MSDKCIFLINLFPSSALDIIQWVIQYKQMSYSFLFKYIIIGDQSVGKSCILMQFIDKQFKVDSDPTIGVQFGSKTIALGTKSIKLQIWDTAGQQAYKSITRSYYRSTVGALLVYDITNRRSFDNLARWLEETHRYASSENIVIMLVGNKADLSSLRQVSVEEGVEFAGKNGMEFCECSAKNGTNVENLFANISQTIIDRIESGRINPNDESGGVKIGDFGPQVAKPVRRCC